jgi:hypothetical protein
MKTAHTALIDHLMLQRGCCWAPGGRYCEIGRELWLQDKAENVATDGRFAMAMIRENHPAHADEIKSRASVLLGDSK